MGLTNNLGKLSNMITSTGSAVGIGQPSPSYTLDVSGTGRFTGALTTGGGVNIGATSFTSPSGADTILGVYGGQDCSLILQDAVQLWELYVNDDFYINRGATTALTISRSTGNVGIGTSSPSKLLTVVNSSNGTAAGFSGTAYGIRFDNGGSFAFGGSTIHGVDNTLTASYQILGLNGLELVFGTSYTERLRMTGGGALQLNSSAYFLCGSSGYRFNNSTDAFNNFVALDNGNATLRGTLTQNASDERLKNNIQIIPNAVEKINSLRGVTFEWNHEIYDTDRTNDIGVIAQDVQKVLPNAVTLAPFDINIENNTSKSGENYLTVYYEKLIPLLIEGIKELSKQNEELSNRLNKAGL